MYLNVISFKNGKTLQFQSTTPFSVDKVIDAEENFKEWILITDEVNGQILSFRGSEVCTIASLANVEPVKDYKPKHAKARGLTVGITKD